MTEETEEFDLCGLGVQVNTVPEIAEMIVKSNDLFSSYFDLFIESYHEKKELIVIHLFYQFDYLL